MKMFEHRTDLMTYSYPLIKIIVCLAIILICIFRNRFIGNLNRFMSIVIAAICFLVGLASILCIYNAVAELFYVSENRKNSRVQNIDCRRIKQFTIDEIETILLNDDIVEFEVIYNCARYKIGASSDCKYSSSIFTDKAYYINDVEYATIEKIKKALIDLFPKGTIPVLTIDGLFPE